MIAVSRFRVDAQGTDAFVGRANDAVNFFRTRAGNQSAELVRNLDDADLWAIVTTWDNVGSYRRSFNGFEAKVILMTLLSEAIDEPSAYAAPDVVGVNRPRGV